VNQLEIVIKAKDEFSATIRQMGEELADAKKAIGSLTDSALKMGVTVGVSSEATKAIIEGLGEAAKKAFEVFSEGAHKLSEYSDQMTRIHEKTGLSVQSLQELNLAGKLSGTGIDAVSAAVVKMEANIEKGAKAFGYLGLSVSELKAMAPDAAFEKIGTAIASIEDPMQKAAANVAIFGKGMNLNPLFEQLKESKERFEELGLVLSDHVMTSGKALNDSLELLGLSMDALQMKVGAAIADSPILTGTLAAITKAYSDMGKGIDSNKKVFEDFSTGALDYLNRLAFGTIQVAEWVVTGFQAIKFATIKLAEAFVALNQLNPMSRALFPVDKWRADLKAMADDTKASFTSQMNDLSALDAAMKKFVENQHAFANGLGGKDGKKGGSFLMPPPGTKTPEQLAKEQEAIAKKWADLEAHIFDLRMKDQQALYDDLMKKNKAALSFIEKSAMGPLGLLPTDLDNAKMMDDWMKKLQADNMAGLKGVDDHILKAATSTKDWKSALQGVTLIAGALGGQFSNVVGVIENIGTAFDKAKNSKDKFYAIAAGVGQIGGIIGGTGGSALQGAAGGAMAGASLGSLIPGIGTVAGAVGGGLLGGIMGLFGASSAQKKELADLKTQLAGLSDEARKFGISLDAALASKNSAAVKSTIDQINAAMQDFEKKTAASHSAASGLNLYVSGLQKEFANIIPEGLKDYYDKVDEEIKKFLEEHAGKVLSKEEQAQLDYMKHNRQSAGDKLDHGDPLNEETQKRFDRVGRFAAATFSGLVKQTGDPVAALKEIGPTLDMLAKGAEEFGFKLTTAEQNMIQMRAALGGDGELADELSGLNQMMAGLGEQGLVDKDLFADFGAEASDVFAKLIAGGATGDQALQLMAPTLQKLYEGEKLHGFAVDESTQAMIDQAKAEGIVGDSFMSANEQIVDLLKILIETIGGDLPDAYKRAGNAADDYANKARNIPIPHVPGNGTGTNGDPQEPFPEDGGHAFGAAFRNYGAGTRTTLHGEEAVLTRPQMDRLVSMAVAGVPGSTVPQGGGEGAMSFPGATIHLHGVQDMDSFNRQLRAAISDNHGGTRRAIRDAVR